ncbi:hypothetical protein J3R82DRAFT_7187 [Butyriboletus roseoflavus]|nr:hypothetical protein J3R82DRAFT_7187 [Butyriboletus roseoflavus]
MGYSSYPRSVVLVLGQSSVYSLLPSTTFAQVESLLQNGRLAEVEALLERTEADLVQEETLRYLHQCLAFAFVCQTRFREATPHFLKGAIDPRVPVSYFDELRPALFGESPSHEKDGSTTLRGVEGDSVEVEVWDGVREYMPDETSVDDIIRNYSPYLRPGAISGSSVGDEPADAEPSTSDSHSESGTRTHPATIAMREGLRGEASEMVKSILAAVLESAELWSREVIEITSTALALLYAHARDMQSLLALFAPPPVAPSTSSSCPVSRSSSRPPSRPRFNIPYISFEWPPGSYPTITITYATHLPTFETCAAISTGYFGTRAYTDEPLGCFGGDVESVWRWGESCGCFSWLLTSSKPTRHRRPTGAAGRGRDKAADRENDTQKTDELVILSELRNTNAIAAKRYLEWLVVGRGLGRGGKETTEEGESFEEYVWNCVEEVLEYVGDEGVGKLWRAKAASYASSPSTLATTLLPPPPLPTSDSTPPFIHVSLQSPLRSPFLSYFASTTPDSPSKCARIKTLLLLQSLREGRKLVKDIQDRITGGGWDKILGLEMAILHSKSPSARITLETLHALRDISTAESYASSGGLTGVVGTKLGVSAAEGCGLSDWSGWFARGSGAAGVKEGEGCTER